MWLWTKSPFGIELGGRKILEDRPKPFWPSKGKKEEEGGGGFGW
jgi:hypothetical protein